MLARARERWRRVTTALPVWCRMSDPDPTRISALQLARAYDDRRLDPLEVTETYLERIEVGSVYRLVSAERALRQAREASERSAAGARRGPLDGVPIAIKDLIDTAGEVTGAGSPPLMARAPAVSDAPVAARLAAAGAVFLGKTTMTELAFSGLGINPFVGTPPNSIDATRVPGGSSSGSAVAVATGLAAIAVGSDTGGSVRIPASFNGLVGLKTTDGWIPTEGTVALSTTLDTLGPIARDADDAWVLAQVMAGARPRPLPAPPQRWSLLAPSSVFWESLDAGVAEVCRSALAALEEAGHSITVRPSTELVELDGLFERFGSFAAHEAYGLYREMLERDGASMDPRVVSRILAVSARSPGDLERLSAERERLRSAFWQSSSGYHALVLPTVRVAPPLLAPLVADDAAYVQANLAVLRSTTLGNLLGGPVATVPVGLDGLGLPVGLSFATAPGGDGQALALAKAAQALVASRRLRLRFGW